MQQAEFARQFHRLDVLCDDETSLEVAPGVAAIAFGPDAVPAKAERSVDARHHSRLARNIIGTTAETADSILASELAL
jgi:hypothetical protein